MSATCRFRAAPSSGCLKSERPGNDAFELLAVCRSHGRAIGVHVGISDYRWASLTKVQSRGTTLM
jgi:hypothetical protein